MENFNSSRAGGCSARELLAVYGLPPAVQEPASRSPVGLHGRVPGV